MVQIRVYGLTCALMLTAALAKATTIVMPTDEQLIEKSPVIVRGTVLSSTPVVTGDAIWTETVLLVEERIKGDAADTVLIREPGGILGDRITRIFGSPDYEAGERVLVFLAPTRRGDFQTVDLFVGKFRASTAADGRAMWVRSDEDPHVELLSADLEPIPASSVQRDAKRFEHFVHERVAGRGGSRDYLVPLRRDGLRTEANFSLIDEPTVYRWFAFDSGSSVSWRSSGTQPGYSGGGINEVRTAMESWTGYSEARILYRYDGTFSTAPGGLNRNNGINEVLLNDPLDEIAGSWNASTGGVVGRGGFNGVSSSRDWKSPFNADSTHQGSYRAWNITEGNLVVQDGVSPGAGIPSTRLAEIIAHEFGHTLGFGHSSDGTALMFANITGRGPALRADDQLAARWLYPGSGSTPTPPPVVTIPAAPSGLTATASGSTVQLQWSDNASNESMQSVYYAAASGSFSKVSDVAANAGSATVTGLSDGTWRFYVTAKNGAGESSPSNTATVTVSTAPPPPLISSFTWSPAAPVADDPVSFTDTSTGGVTSRRWNFGDGTSSTQATPVKRYTAPGTYTVSLTAYRGAESRVSMQSITIATRAPAQPPQEAYRSLIPVSSQSEGVAGSIWRTELTIFNAGSEGVTVGLLFVPQAGSAVQNRSVFVSPRQSVIYANALRDLFGMSSGSGAIAIEATGATATPLLKVTSRTFNDASDGTYGLAVPDVVAADLHQTLYLTGMATTADYRTNVGLVNRSAGAVSASLTLYGSNGTTLATANVTVPASSFRQDTLATFFPAVANRDLTGMSMRIDASVANALSAYASVVDNRTHDPLYIGAVGLPERTEAIVPIVGRGAGAHGTFWRSDVTIFNPGSSWLSVSLLYGGQRKSHFIGPRQTLVIADIVADHGIEAGIGTLIVTWTNPAGPIITTRNYTPAPAGGTFGQSIDPVARFGTETYVAGLRSDHAFRANLGFVNGGTQPMTVQATLFTAAGTQAGTTTLQLNPDQVLQTSVGALFPGATGNLTLRATSNVAGLFAYGSVIDNASGDPVFIAGR